MDQQKKKTFIINVIYLLVLGGVLYFVLKQVLPMFFPFVFGLAVAIVLNPVVKWFQGKTKLKRGLSSIVILVIFYLLLALLFWFCGNRILLFLQNRAAELPGFYNRVVEPEMSLLFDRIRAAFPGQESKMLEVLASLENSVQNGIMSLSSSLIGLGASWIVGFPGMLVQAIFTLISSFFFTIDFERITGFVLRQFSEPRQKMIVEVVTSAKIVVIKILRVYALLMSLTFVELLIGFKILGMPMALLLAFLIAIVDILPVLGTGTVLLPWGIILCVVGQPVLGIGIFLLYLFITVVRQILEPRIIGQQVGLHPIVTLLCIFAGAQMAGVIGIFLFPVTATIIKKMNDEGTIHLFK